MQDFATAAVTAVVTDFMTNGWIAEITCAMTSPIIAPSPVGVVAEGPVFFFPLAGCLASAHCRFLVVFVVKRLFHRFCHRLFERLTLCFVTFIFASKSAESVFLTVRHFLSSNPSIVYTLPMGGRSRSGFLGSLVRFMQLCEYLHLHA